MSPTYAQTQTYAHRRRYVLRRAVQAGRSSFYLSRLNSLLDLFCNLFLPRLFCRCMFWPYCWFHGHQQVRNGIMGQFWQWAGKENGQTHFVNLEQSPPTAFNFTARQCACTWIPADFLGQTGARILGHHHINSGSGRIRISHSASLLHRPSQSHHRIYGKWIR